MITRVHSSSRRPPTSCATRFAKPSSSGSRKGRDASSERSEAGRPIG
nr:MAG TPA: hypothetical protein [Bacteriophage sp.]